MSDNENADETALGRCPECEMGIPRGRLLARYESPCGPARVLAECPACTTVVPPA